MTSSRHLLVVLSLPVALALGLVAFFLLPAGSPLLLSAAVPVAVVAAVLRGTAPTPSAVAAPDARARRRGAALLLAPVLGLGTWLFALVVGILLGVVPFMVPLDPPHPWTDAWVPGSALLGLVSVPLWWWWIDGTVGGRH
ncbi:hypothetical protein [Nocardioides solisilvae]|uniref:hypothetical protein n=1 Tax=Nocardioides solisilvae TaxID=1542435 RepID=UPI0013A52EAB|nr:hypothetical protein [Nocardioides solisilvae]